MINPAISAAIDKSLGIVKKYIDDKGEVYLIKDTNCFFVSVIKQLGPGHEIYRERGRLSTLSAEEFFDAAVRYVRDEIEWAEPVRKYSCKFNRNKSRACYANNCPHTLGGDAYWEMFGKSCLYRHANTR